jgi:6-phosphogluconolactonase
MTLISGGNRGIRLEQFSSAAELASAAVLRFLDRLHGQSGNPGLVTGATIQEQTRAANFNVALSGGRIAKTFFECLASSVINRPIPGNVHFFWADERCVPPEHTDSNFKLFQETVLRGSIFDSGQIHRIEGELPPEEAAERASQTLRACVSAAASGSVPVLDLVLLGMGEDGHIASLFPGEPPDAEIEGRLFRAVLAPKPPPQRITMSYALLENARDVWVLASGSGKEEALRNSLTSGGSTPLARLLRSRSDTSILSDFPGG